MGKREMKQLLWKIRFSVRFCYLTRMSPGFAWEAAGSWMEMLNGDTSQSAAECVDEEIEESLRG